MMGITANIDGARQSASRLLRSFRDDESGATAIEYGLIVALLFLAIVGGVRAFTQTTSGMYMTVSDTLQDQIE